MTGRTRSSARHHSGIGAALAAGAVGALVLAGATACASATKSVSVSEGGSSSGAATASASPSASASASAGASATPSNHTMIPAGGTLVTPKAQLSAVPAGQKLTAFQTAAHSADGKTLYLGLESQGGACGQYDVVLQQTGSTVSVGLVHLSSGGVMCPMFVGHTLVVAQLSAPLDGRHVVDLADGQTVTSAQIG